METNTAKLKENTAILSVISNSVLVVLKLIVGIYSGAVSIVSEAAHSGVDLLASGIAWYSVRQSDKLPDERHAYGHGKIENISATVEAVLIIVAAVWIIYEAAEKFMHPKPMEYLGWGVGVMAISVVANMWVSRRLYKVAKETGSQALEADAMHLTADIWTSGGVLVGLGLIYITGYQWLDPAVAIVVAGIIFKAGYTMTRKNLVELTDISLPAEEEKMIREVIGKHPEVFSFHQLRTRRSGNKRLLDVHVLLQKDISLEQAHTISHEVEDRIKGVVALADVVIHMEPCDHVFHCGKQCPKPCNHHVAAEDREPDQVEGE